MKKKFLALVLTLAMVLSLVPATALATDGTSDTTTKDVVYGHYTNTGEWESGKPENAIPGSLKDTVTTVDKTAEKVAGQDNQYDVTLTVQMKHKTTEVPPGAAATVLVIDTSDSMERDTKCIKKEHTHDDTCYIWETCTQENHPLHYVWWKGEYVHIPRSSCKRDGNRYAYQRLICDKEQHKHGRNCKKTSRIAAAKVAAEKFLNSYRGGTVSEDGGWTPSETSLQRYVSIVSFNTGVSKNDWVDVSTKKGYDKAIASINALSADGGTNLDAGLRMANAQLNNSTVQGMPANVVVLTDGKPTFYLGDQKDISGDYYSDWNVIVGENTYRVHGNGSQCDDATYTTTVSTATTLKQDASASVYTVCFGASSETLGVQGNPTVSEFLRMNIATQAEGKTYAYDANDTTDLYKAFAAISSSVVSGLNTGTVEDALPAGVSCTQGGIFDDSGRLTWELKADDASESEADENGFITYTYEKKYTVEIDPTANGLHVVNGYVPLNQPTILTVQNGNEKVKIPFPIPAGKVTYSLTNFNKELVTKSDTLSFDTNGFIIPDTKDSTVTVGENGVTLLYKITVQGNPGAKFTVRDDGATLVSPDTIADGEDSTFSGTVGNTGTTVFYVSKQFTKRDISSDTQTVSNTATIDPGDNAKGPADDEKTKTVTTTVTEATPQTYTVIFDAKGGNWSENETQKTRTYNGSSASVTRPEEPTKSGYLFVAWTYENADGSYEEIPNGASLTVNQLMNLPKADTANRKVTLYAKWRLNPEDQITYTIHQHFMKDADNEDGAINYYTTSQEAPQEAPAGTSISSLIPNSLINKETRYKFGYSEYLYGEAKVGTTPYNGTETLQANNTAIHLYYYLDEVGETSKENPNGGPDNIPDAWQYKVTFKVSNGKWDDKTTADVVAYVTNKKDNTPCAKGTEGSKATLNGVTIPVAGNRPDSGYKASGKWNTKPSTDLEIKEDTVFIYTYDQKSGGSGGSGGSNRPKPPVVEIPDDVPTGLNGKDHYAYVVGYPDGMVYPQKNITRAEVATIFFRLLTDETREANMTKSNGYNDMKDGAWYTCAVSTLSKMGIIKGYEDGSFKPDASISRAEFAAIAARFDPNGDKTPATFSDVSSHWAKDEISIAANHGWIKGYEDGSFKPDQKITRAETMTLVNRVLKRLPETKDDLHKDMKTWPDNQNESAWFYLAVQEATNSHYQKLKKDGTHETWESMRETRDWAALEK